MNLDNINPVKSAFTAITSAFAGSISYSIDFMFISLETINTLFQHVAWTIAILAGIVSIVNGAKGWKIFKKFNKDEDKL